jgi:aldose 1-epimerase
VRDGVLHYQEKAYPQVKRGVTIYEHGLVHNEPWNNDEPDVQGDTIHMHTWIDINSSSAVFEAFPFPHRLSLDYYLDGSGIKVVYSIENQGNTAIPFGFGLHPYFMKLSGDDGTMVELPAACVMQTTPDLLPTGQLIEVSGTRFDLCAPACIGALDLDHVFTHIPDGKAARIIYTTLGFSVRLAASRDFTHLVLYSPPGADFFCLENQTCSTDAHNLYQRGFTAESGLKFVPAGKTHTGSVTYEILREE